LIAKYPGAYKEKVMTLLRFGKTNEAAGACKEWITLQPNHWLPRFTLAHLRWRLGESDAASAEFAGWVHEHQNFAHCIYLALFNYRDWFTPYDTDEAGWHGSEDIPSPYPKTWRSGKVSSN
jgi:hypothetical protein